MLYICIYIIQEIIKKIIKIIKIFLGICLWLIVISSIWLTSILLRPIIKSTR